MKARQAKKQAHSTRTTEPVYTLTRMEYTQVEVTRSYSMKLNLERIDPTRRYENVDIFFSQKAYCSPDKVEETAAVVYAFCRKMVIADYNKEIENVHADRDARKAVGQGAPR